MNNIRSQNDAIMCGHTGNRICFNKLPPSLLPPCRCAAPSSRQRRHGRLVT